MISCSVTPNKLDRGSQTTDEERIATDLVSALMQIPEYQPFTTTLQLSRKQNAFGSALTEALTSAGYGVQIVEQDQGKNYVYYSASDVINESSVEQSVYSISINTITMSREFKRHINTLVPSSKITIQGVEPTRIIVNDTLYRQQAGTAVIPTGARFIDENGSAIETPQSLSTASIPFTRITGENLAKERILIMAKSNIYTNNRITNETYLHNANLKPLRKTTIVFNPNTLHLGAPNKNALLKLSDKYRPNQHIFDLIACSHGLTLLMDGTESDSLERSLRTKEELLQIGVLHTDIKENGCFNDLEYSPPQRGVVVTLKTRI